MCDCAILGRGFGVNPLFCWFGLDLFARRCVQALPPGGLRLAGRQGLGGLPLAGQQGPGGLPPA